MILLMLLNAGCVRTSYVSDYCLWGDAITVTEAEIDSLSEETLRQIDHHNQEYKKYCLD
jgi:hypothetical protein